MKPLQLPGAELSGALRLDAGSARLLSRAVFLMLAAMVVIAAAAAPAAARVHDGLPQDAPGAAEQAHAADETPVADDSHRAGDSHAAAQAHGESGGHGGGGQFDAVGHSADGYYLDFSPLGSIELPRLMLATTGSGSVTIDAFTSTHAALQSGAYGLGSGSGTMLSLSQMEAAIANHEHLYFPLVRTEGSIVVDLSITRHLVFLLLGALILLIIALDLARRYKRGVGRTSAPKGLWHNMMETFVIFIRDEIAKPTIGRGYQKYLPYLFTAFFLILLCNWLGLVPWGASATSNIMVTGTLAVCTLVAVLFSGTREYYAHMFNPPGVPLVVKFILAPIEVIGVFTKHVALAFRLFGNMVSGHLVLLSILGLIFIFAAQFGSPVGWSVAFIVSVPLTIFIFVLKLAVGLIQAYVFTILSALFIGLALEEHEHGHEETATHDEQEQYREHAMDRAEKYVPDRAQNLEETLEDGARRRKLAEATV